MEKVETWGQATEQVRLHIEDIPGHASSYPLQDLLSVLQTIDQYVADGRSGGGSLAIAVASHIDRVGPDKAHIIRQVADEIWNNDPAKFARNWCAWADAQMQLQELSDAERDAGFASAASADGDWYTGGW